MYIPSLFQSDSILMLFFYFFFQIQHNVRPDSNLILSAAQEIINEAGFDELLENVRNRIDEIESLHRTREITVRYINVRLPALIEISFLQFKDLNNGDTIRLSVDKRGAELLATLNKDGDWSRGSLKLKSSDEGRWGSNCFVILIAVGRKKLIYLHVVPPKSLDEKYKKRQKKEHQKKYAAR